MNLQLAECMCLEAAQVPDGGLIILREIPYIYTPSDSSAVALGDTGTCKGTAQE